MASRIDFTNYQTSMSMAINPKKVAEIVDEMIASLSSWIGKVTNIIDVEKTTGGLSMEALDFGGVAPLNENATAIEEELNEMIQIAEEIKQKLVSEASNQKQEELKTLKQAVENHINELYTQLSKLNSALAVTTTEAEKSGINIEIERLNNTIETWQTVLESIVRELGNI